MELFLAILAGVALTIVGMIVGVVLVLWAANATLDDLFDRMKR